ncbi:p-hydroxybenzoic acid efflux pump subunit AaeA [Hartmannibacter diazotrophicus]|uniref:p-hydroxybenzoic acid efflux pump subunit AaeA n=1 Tax=Hartmannibacter diazotrophicus TaxID=1482074 RepID=A0A2C9DA41_9HYPH|nr:HlyD family secretion protein [Hartmannibacter diazotrophicus]SON57103.1 p-hydroxybenzoic acid efflux pump subunit AaeA [Hartmannibacter diazotrophicus]
MAAAEKTSTNVTSLAPEKPAVPEASAAEIRPPEAAPAKAKKSRLRWPLMLAVPLLIVVGGGYVWATSGRYESTDNAYVKHDIVSIGPDISGRIDEVPVHENQQVKAGDILFRIDDDQYKLALEEKNAALAAARLQVQQLQAAWRNANSAEKEAQETLAYQQTVMDRQQQLLSNGTASRATYDASQHDLETAKQALVQSQQAVDSARAALGGNPDIAVDEHPLVLQAIAARDKAQLDLKHTVVRAPADGIVSEVGVLKVGQYVSEGETTVSLVETDNVWVEANFKETQLTHMKPGDKVTLDFDAFPSKDITGTVQSLGAGTGSVFSILPAQNATGNWVKVVQRVPVRISIDDDNVKQVLASGLSSTVDVDTGWQRPLPQPIRSAMAALGLEPAVAAEVAQK